MSSFSEVILFPIFKNPLVRFTAEMLNPLQLQVTVVLSFGTRSITVWDTMVFLLLLFPVFSICHCSAVFYLFVPKEPKKVWLELIECHVRSMIGAIFFGSRTYEGHRTVFQCILVAK